jgi:hypothetical protein
MPIPRLLLALALLGPVSPALAGEFGVNLYGLSYHFERSRAKALGVDNEFNPGLGARYLIGENRRFKWFADGGIYRDSGRNTAKYGGAGVQWRATESLGVGAALVAFHSDSYNRGRSFIAPLPVVSWDYRAVTFNLTYFPKVNKLNDVNALGLWVTLWPGRW